MRVGETMRKKHNCYNKTGSVCIGDEKKIDCERKHGGTNSGSQSIETSDSMSTVSLVIRKMLRRFYKISDNVMATENDNGGPPGSDEASLDAQLPTKIPTKVGEEESFFTRFTSTVTGVFNPIRRLLGKEEGDDWSLADYTNLTVCFALYMLVCFLTYGPESIGEMLLAMYAFVPGVISNILGMKELTRGYRMTAVTRYVEEAVKLSIIGTVFNMVRRFFTGKTAVKMARIPYKMMEWTRTPRSMMTTILALQAATVIWYVLYYVMATYDDDTDTLSQNGG